jgi:hypothetical protein
LQVHHWQQQQEGKRDLDPEHGKMMSDNSAAGLREELCD